MRVAVVGLGRMGRRHLEVVQRLGMEVVGLCDQSQQCIDAVRQELSIAESLLFRDAREMLQRIRPQAVVIATTAPSHADLVRIAADAGSQYVLCEKPMATSVAQARSMMEVCRAHDVVLGINHQMQFMVQYVEIQAAARSRELGRLVSIFVCGSNFGLAMNGSHYFEVFRFLIGAEARTVQAWLDPQRVPNPRGAQFEDRGGKVRVTGDDGVSMYLDCSVAAGHGLNLMYLFEFGQIFVDELTGFVRIARRKDEHRAEPTTRYAMPTVEQIRQLPPKDIVEPTRKVWEAMLANRPFPGPEVGLHAIMCLTAAHTSHELGSECLRLDDERIDPARVYPWA